jgi:hypothetical protein
MAKAVVSPTCETGLLAWLSAPAHRIANSEMALYLESTPGWSVEPLGATPHGSAVSAGKLLPT